MEELLKLIGNVDPTDSAALDEIDARVWCYLEGKPFAEMLRSGQGFRYLLPNQFEITVFQNTIPKYSRSRDALKAIRPKGYWSSCNENGTKGWQASLNDPDGTGQYFYVTGMPTEELAELHAIIQAIEYDRRN